jgi:hypothetical protein
MITPALVVIAKKAALAELHRVGIADTFCVKLKRPKRNEWVAMYRGGTQFTGRGRGPIFWISTTLDVALAEAYAEDGNPEPNESDVLNQLTDSLLHEYGHVVAEWARLRSDPMMAALRIGWRRWNESDGWDEERFAEDFAQWLRGGYVHGPEDLIVDITRLYVAEVFTEETP